MPETPKGNLDTYIDGLKSAERKPTSKTPFVATVADEHGNKTRRPLNVVSYKADGMEDLKINDDLLHDAGTMVGANYTCLVFTLLF